MQVDKVALDALHDNAELHLQSFEPWIQVLHCFYPFFSYLDILDKDLGQLFGCQCLSKNVRLWTTTCSCL